MIGPDRWVFWSGVLLGVFLGVAVVGTVLIWRHLTRAMGGEPTARADEILAERVPDGLRLGKVEWVSRYDPNDYVHRLRCSVTDPRCGIEPTDGLPGRFIEPGSGFWVVNIIDLPDKFLVVCPVDTINPMAHRAEGKQQT